MNHPALRLALTLALLGGCSSNPPADDGGGGGDPAVDATLTWAPLPHPGAVLERPLQSLPHYLKVDPKPITVPGATKSPQRHALPLFAAAQLASWREQGWVVAFDVAEDNTRLPGAFLGSIDTSGSMWHKLHRARVVVDDPHAVAVELLVESRKPVADFEVRLRGLLIEPRLAPDAPLNEHLQTLGIDPAGYAIEAVHPDLGAVYAGQGLPGRLLVTQVDGTRRVTAIFQGPLPKGFTPWSDLEQALRARQAANQPLGPLAPWIRHAAFGELEAVLGTPAVTAAEHQALEQTLLGALQSNVTPGQFVTALLHAQEVERGLALGSDLQPLLKGMLPQLREHAMKQRDQAAARSLPIVAATWGWLAWELRDPGAAKPTFGEPLRAAVLPVLFGDVRYGPTAVAETPLGRRGEVPLTSVSVKRADGLARWKVAAGDFDSIRGAPDEEVPTKVTWKEPNPAYDTWIADMEELQDQIDFNVQSVPTIEVPTGRVLRGGQVETEKVPDTNSTEYVRAEQLQSELDVLALDEPPELIEREKTIPVTVQRYTGSVTRRYTILAEDERVIDAFDEVTEVNLALRRHAAVPEAGVAALDEHQSLEDVSRTQRRGVIEGDLPRYYREVLQRALRAELERRLPEGVDPGDAADELAWGQWWLGLKVDDDLRPALGPVLELQEGSEPLLRAAPKRDAAGSRTPLEGLLKQAGSPQSLPR